MVSLACRIRETAGHRALNAASLRASRPPSSCTDLKPDPQGIWPRRNSARPFVTCFALLSRFHRSDSGAPEYRIGAACPSHWRFYAKTNHQPSPDRLVGRPDLTLGSPAADCKRRESVCATQSDFRCYRVSRSDRPESGQFVGNQHEFDFPILDLE